MAQKGLADGRRPSASLVAEGPRGSDKARAECPGAEAAPPVPGTGAGSCATNAGPAVLLAEILVVPSIKEARVNGFVVKVACGGLGALPVSPETTGPSDFCRGGGGGAGPFLKLYLPVVPDVPITADASEAGEAGLGEGGTAASTSCACEAGEMREVGDVDVRAGKVEW